MSLTPPLVTRHPAKESPTRADLLVINKSDVVSYVSGVSLDLLVVHHSTSFVAAGVLDERCGFN
jgi:Ni2+-binding GTPase involved in maturation of urease and hydrogenase